MKRLGLRFDPRLFTIGATLLSVSSGIAGFVPELLLPSIILFLSGLVVIGRGVITIRQKAIVVHESWDPQRVYSALRRAPDDAVVRILQTWFPEENFIDSLQSLYLDHNKHFDLRVMLLKPYDANEEPTELVTARVSLRGMTPARGAEEVRSTIARLVRMKEAVDHKRREQSSKGRRPGPVDLEIRLYDFMPFGPIYQIAEDVAFVGVFLNYATSAEGPMLEVRNTPNNRLWRLLEHHFDEGWASPTSVVVYPQTSGLSTVLGVGPDVIGLRDRPA